MDDYKQSLFSLSERNMILALFQLLFTSSTKNFVVTVVGWTSLLLFGLYDNLSEKSNLYCAWKQWWFPFLFSISTVFKYKKTRNMVSSDAVASAMSNTPDFKATIISIYEVTIDSLLKLVRTNSPSGTVLFNEALPYLSYSLRCH